MMIHAKHERMEEGNYQWLWNLMDDTTRFWISSTVYHRREVADARRVFQDSKNKTNHTKPIIHDGLKSYDESFIANCMNGAASLPPEKIIDLTNQLFEITYKDVGPRYTVEVFTKEGTDSEAYKRHI
jgi:transposase-like protein